MSESDARVSVRAMLCWSWLATMEEWQRAQALGPTYSSRAALPFLGHHPALLKCSSVLIDGLEAA